MATTGNNFYISCTIKDDFLFLVSIEDGKKKHKILKYSPYMFVPYQGKSPYKNMHGDSVRKVEFNNIRHARSFIYNKKGETTTAEEQLENIVYGNTNYHYVYLADNYMGEVQYDASMLTILNVDIEVSSENGFPSAEVASEKVIAITIKVSGPRVKEKDTVVYGLKEYTPTKDNVLYKKYDTEKDLLSGFIADWEKVKPDIVTGWYIELFDIPYLLKRIERIFGKEEVNRFSPWGIVSDKMSITPGKKHGQLTYDILGVSILDYISLYKKFAPHPGQESYSLNNIAHVELGERKLSYAEYGNLNVLYEADHQKFIDYNIKDVELVSELEKKLGLISLVVATAYNAKVNFYDVFSQVRMWDTIIYNALMEKNIVLPPRKDNDKHGYPGAFVKEPLPGVYDWVASLDLDSMYPNIMIQWNISPETLVPEIVNPDFLPIIPNVKVDAHESKRSSEAEEYAISALLDNTLDTSYLLKKGVGLSAAGHHFRNDKVGFLPEILIKMYNVRQEAKSKKMKYKAQLSMIEDELKGREG